MHSKQKEDVVPFRVALMLKRYRFGSNIAARYLGKPRGLVQSWMQAGESHALAQSNFKLGAFEKKLRKVRQKLTQENIFYLMAMKLIDLKLPPEFIGRNLGLPLSTVRSWKEGVSPKSANRLFIDRDILDREFKNVMEFLRSKSTRENLLYYLSIKLSESGQQKVGRRRIGGKTISRILTGHFNLVRSIPKETITCWIDKRRRPKNAFEVLKDNEFIEGQYRKIEDELTDEHMDYHMAQTLYSRYDWSYSRISKTLELDKEKVRGWVKKNRGNPIAKCFKNEGRVKESLKEYVNEEPHEEETNESVEKALEAVEARDNGFDTELEDEILYHLAFFPSGISSPRAIKSILIDNKDAEIRDIEEVFNKSPRILRNGSRWTLKE